MSKFVQLKDPNTGENVYPMMSSENPIVLTGTLPAGNTSLILTDSAIIGNVFIDVYTNIYGVNPTNITVTEGSIALTFDVLNTDLSVRVEVK